MGDVQRVVESVLSSLVGHPLTGAARASDMLTLQFGAKHQRQTPMGRTVETGQWALHIQCPWRVSKVDGIHTGRGDYWQPPDLSSSDTAGESWHPELGNRWDERMRAWIESRETSPSKPQSVSSDCLGGMRLYFDDGFILEVFPDGTEIEDWRFIEWSGGDDFVVTGGKLEA